LGGRGDSSGDAARTDRKESYPAKGEPNAHAKTPDTDGWPNDDFTNDPDEPPF
jgi:hypothetical protein